MNLLMKYEIKERKKERDLKLMFYFVFCNFSIVVKFGWIEGC